jgi:hypothetical protein
MVLCHLNTVVQDQVKGNMYFDSSCCFVNIDDVLLAQGADPRVIRDRSLKVLRLTEQAMILGQSFLNPAAWIETFFVQGFKHNTILLENKHHLKGEVPAQYLAGAKEVTGVIGTIGHELEVQIEKYMENDPPLGYALDSFGSASTAAFSNYLVKQIESRAAERGISTSFVINPGMSGWPLDEGQSQLFDLLRPDPQIIRLTPSSQMIPRKSFSFVIGAGCSKNGVDPCESCVTRNTCPKWRFKSE